MAGRYTGSYLNISERWQAALKQAAERHPAPLLSRMDPYSPPAVTCSEEQEVGKMPKRARYKISGGTDVAGCYEVTEGH